MPRALEIYISFIDGPHYVVPHNDAHREILVGAQNGDFVVVTVNGKQHFGRVVEKTS